jgi:hypothetical protein
MCHLKEERVRVMMFTATFNNISAISWRSVLLAEETKVPGENQRPDASNCQTCIEYTSQYTGFKLTTLVVIKRRNNFNLQMYFRCNENEMKKRT